MKNHDFATKWVFSHVVHWTHTRESGKEKMHLENKKSMQNSGALNHLLYYISILVVNCNLSFEFSTSVGPWPSPAVNLKEVLLYYIRQDWAGLGLSAF